MVDIILTELQTILIGFWNNCNMYVAYHDYTQCKAVTMIVDFLLENNFCTKLEQQGSMIILKKETNLQNLIAL